jgi:hypothetical protein
MSWISHQQAVAQHWDLPNTEIFQSKDVASASADIFSERNSQSGRNRKFYFMKISNKLLVKVKIL